MRNEYCFLIMMEVLKKVITTEPWTIKGYALGYAFIPGNRKYCPVM